MSILAVNGGSSSLKCALFGGGPGLEPLLEILVSDIHGAARVRVRDPASARVEEFKLDLTGTAADERHARCMERVLKSIEERSGLPPVQAIGHRVVHGGTLFEGPVLINGAVVDQLTSLVSLAPLHQPASIALIRACLRYRPDLPQCACFDTTFHRGQEARERAYALPEELTRAGIHRYGFHGLSYEYVTRQLIEQDGAYAARRIVIAHLGAGASLCAVHGGRSVATTMGFSALDGLPMGSRCGSIDPGVLLYLMREHGLDADALEDLLYRRSGWLGVSGISAEMRVLRASPEPAAARAIEQFVYRVVRETGSLAAAMGGIDCLVFTGGIGENDARLRQSVADGCNWLGMRLDPGANRVGAARISDASSRIEVRVQATDEAAMIARHTATTTGASHG